MRVLARFRSRCPCKELVHELNYAKANVEPRHSTVEKPIWEGVPFMRKDVKLGMAIGGGLIVLLVGYLLFAPPSNGNKKGAQFVGGTGSPNIIDGGQSGELTSNGGGDEKSTKGAEQPVTPKTTGPDTR